MPDQSSVLCACGCGQAVKPGRRFRSGHNGHTGTLAERFWAKVDRATTPDGCWPWTGGTAGRGYGIINVGPASAGKDYAHRVAYRLQIGPIPPGALVRHVVCDNPPCCRGDHLAVGSVADNTADMMRRGRGSNGTPTRGEDHPWAKIDAALVVAIRAAHAAGRSQRSLAREHGISKSLVGAVVLRKAWSHVP